MNALNEVRELYNLMLDRLLSGEMTDVDAWLLDWSREELKEELGV